MYSDRTGASLPAQESPSAELQPLAGIKYNPGNLRAYLYRPARLTKPAPLVVLLHGCTQSAVDYDRGTGWSRLAERHGFVLLFPQQRKSNNPMRCFNWFQAGDSQRGMGEPASIKAMVDAVRAATPIDERRIFITGLSAGGAMTSVMLATYPELFAAGAIIAGVPYGCASGVREAFDCMGGRDQSDDSELAAKVRRASPHKGPWPRVSIWQGSADRMVMPSNADGLTRQWVTLHGLPPEPGRTDTVEGYPHAAWLDAGGQVAVERYDITGMAHGVPLMPGLGEGESGVASAHMLDAHISSTDRIAAFFGLAPDPMERLQRRTRPGGEAGAPVPWEASPAFGPGAVIDKALRAAGLLR